jgi:hypothetical protein
MIGPLPTFNIITTEVLSLRFADLRPIPAKARDADFADLG